MQDLIKNPHNISDSQKLQLLFDLVEAEEYRCASQVLEYFKEEPRLTRSISRRLVYLFGYTPDITATINVFREIFTRSDFYKLLCDTVLFYSNIVITGNIVDWFYKNTSTQDMFVVIEHIDTLLKTLIDRADLDNFDIFWNSRFLKQIKEYQLRMVRSAYLGEEIDEDSVFTLHNRISRYLVKKGNN